MSVTADVQGEHGSLQWAVAAAILLTLTCVLAGIARIHPVHVGFESRDAPHTARPDMRLNLNSATAGELQALPRIGPTLAARIAESRDLDGPFTSIEDLTRITGIGDRTIELIAAHVVVLPASSTQP